MKIPDNSHQVSPLVLDKKSGKPDSFTVQKTKQSVDHAKTPLSTDHGLRNSGPGVQGARHVFPGGTAPSGLLSFLKLPQDNISHSLVAFARFFSLPLEPKFLGLLRRDVLSQKSHMREAAALGTAAAADKSLKLGEKALSEYAAAIRGSVQSFLKEKSGISAAAELHKDGEDRNRDEQRDDSREERGEGKSFSEFSGGNFGTNARQNPKEKHPSHDKIKRRLTKILEEKPILDFLNRIPGKKTRWIVIPYYFCQNGYEFNISLRIILSNNTLPAAETGLYERLTAEIVVNKADEKTTIPSERKDSGRWIISLERPVIGSSGGPEGFAGSRISFFSDRAGKSPAKDRQLRQDLAKALNLPLDRVILSDKPLLFADSRAEPLRSVDEEV